MMMHGLANFKCIQYVLTRLFYLNCMIVHGFTNFKVTV